MTEKIITTEEIKAKVQEFVTTYEPEKAPQKAEEAKVYLVNAIDEGIKLYNSIIGTSEAKAEDTAKVFKGIKALEDKYNTVSKTEYQENKKIAPEGAMMAAIKDPTYPTVRVRNVKSDDGVIRLAAGNVNKTINLISLHKFCGGIGVDHAWVNGAKKMWLSFVARGVFEKLPDDADEDAIKKALTDFLDCDFMKGIAKAKTAGKNLTSNTKLLENLTELIKRMIGEEYKPLTHDVRYILQAYSMKDRKEMLSVKYCTEKGFADILLDVCRRIVCNEAYKDNYKYGSKK